MTVVHLDRETEAAVHHLRTLLEEARGVLRMSANGGRAAMLDRRIEHLQHEAEHFAPDFHRD